MPSCMSDVLQRMPLLSSLQLCEFPFGEEHISGEFILAGLIVLKKQLSIGETTLEGFLTRLLRWPLLEITWVYFSFGIHY